MTFPHRLVIGINYGETSTSVAFAYPMGLRADFEDISILDCWGAMGNADRIPSAISYSEASVAGERQWGYDIRPGSMSLDGMNDLTLEHIEASRGRPEYPAFSPIEIVSHYLGKVFYHVKDEFSFMGRLLDIIPVDVVIAVSPGWSYQARSSFFAAVRKAGFNENNLPNLKDYIMIEDPMAAALYSARCFENDGKRILRPDETFLVCYSGEIFTEITAYRVTQKLPNLDVERNGVPTRAKCGIATIDLKFKEWLRDVLGDQIYSTIDVSCTKECRYGQQSEAGPMRDIMTQFTRLRNSFNEDTRARRLELPEPLSDLKLDNRVEEGELRITSAEMSSFIDPLIDELITLLKAQVECARERGNRIQRIFIYGDDIWSNYIQWNLIRALACSKIIVHRAKSGCDVVRGAVIYGIEKSFSKNDFTVHVWPRSIGILSGDAELTSNRKLTWLVLKGDLISVQDPKSEEQDLVLTSKVQKGARFFIALYEYFDGEHLPTFYGEPNSELNRVGLLSWELSSVLVSYVDIKISEETGDEFYAASATLRTTVRDFTMKLEVFFRGIIVATTVLEDIHKISNRGSYR